MWGRCVLGESRQAEALTKAALALDRVLAGEHDDWEGAERAYGRAARASLLDAYPLWVVEVIASWRASVAGPSDTATQAVLSLVRARAYGQALQAARALEPSRGRDYLIRFVGDLHQAATSRAEK